MRQYKIRLKSTAEPVKVEAKGFTPTNQNDNYINFFVYDKREIVGVASFRKKDVVSITSVSLTE